MRKEGKIKKREFDSKKRYLFAFLIATIVFILVFILTYYLSFLEFQRISNKQVGLSYQIFEPRLEHELFDKNVCSNEFQQKVFDELGFQGNMINELERKLDKNNKDVLLRKKFYTLVELEHYNFLKFLERECNQTTKNIIFFFYSNKEEDIDKSEEVGHILSVLYARNPDLIIYSFDVDLDSLLIAGLKEKYEITGSLEIILNEKHHFKEDFTLEEIEKYFS